MNPVLTKANFEAPATTNSVMTMSGTIGKCVILFAMTLIAASYTWYASFNGYANVASTYACIGGIVGFIIALVTCFKQEWSPVTAPIYALCEGLLLGGVSAMYEKESHGLATQAVLLTFGTFAGMLFLFQANILRATPAFVKIIVAATFGVCISYLIGMLLSLFHINTLNNSIFGNGTIGIGFSAVVVLIAAFNLIIDFEFIKENADSGSAPKYMEWYSAFGLLVTVVWLYLEILRLLAKLNKR
jgi:uncharacterized YccA/Bax inhibitor family protein